MTISTKKSLIILIILIALSGFVVWFYQYQQAANQQVQEVRQKIDNQFEEAKTQQPLTTTTIITSALKTYHNEQWGFEFQYPEDWIVKENTFGSYYSKFNLVVNPELVRSSNFTFSINIVLPEFPERSFRNIEKTTSEITVAGVRGIKYEYEFEGLPETAIILPLGEYKIILGTDSEQYLDEFNQILTSFKFIK